MDDRLQRDEGALKSDFEIPNWISASASNEMAKLISTSSSVETPLQGRSQSSHHSHMAQHVSHTKRNDNLETRATGGKVSNKALQISAINNNDGIGAGKDAYVQYAGNGSSFPLKTKWVSFVDM